MAAVGGNIASGWGYEADAAWFIPAWTLSITRCGYRLARAALVPGGRKYVLPHL
ncbi:uncharacterized protein Z519_01830 [Cladophialophora bantiana CBS 173.52]|uniref:Uncharacterized protein n=1 Tax=Cladophialophora bantiana (strain ATCC 10958 / CBS 173.52 / CDC B-1940 / NIH 8579) TaxID=1442370 RepID=A0A0D2F833_CLAB1|nr:uncharacterized protein Z519_01830 [Cladophialophora bantiana CBS 173.52]KIW98246.1 hypothetical protein Z519_01830 [Cladophialophora bantiana CBS 173.52]